MSKKLPDSFRQKMTAMLGEEEYLRYEACLLEPLQHGLRVNTGRMTTERFLKISPWKLEQIPWCESGFYLSEDAAEDPPSKSPYYYAGLYYLQEPSAMLPAATLPVNPGDRVLDLCAAPGGKSTALAEKLKGKGVLLCNDISPSRAKALIKNLELFGVTNAVVTAEEPERLAGAFPDYFDKILIDAPCSGEGMFRKSASMITDWTEEKQLEYAEIQRSILPHALRMLRPGGMILYSTCTYAPVEDEGSVQFLLDLPESKEKQLTVADIPMVDGFLPGNPDWIPEGSEALKKTVHLIPHRVRGEGHFVALLKSELPKEAGAEQEPTASENAALLIRKKHPEFAEFAKQIKTGIDPDRLVNQNGYLSYVPAEKKFKELRSLRVMRRGLFLGEVKKNRFEPSQALAMTLSPETFDNCLNLSMDDERVLRYLRGETLEYDAGEAKDGWVLITADQLPLGFGKAKNGQIKNKYLPGWRMT